MVHYITLLSLNLASVSLYRLSLKEAKMSLSLYNWVLTTDATIDGYCTQPHSHSFKKNNHSINRAVEMQSSTECEKTEDEYKHESLHWIKLDRLKCHLTLKNPNTNSYKNERLWELGVYTLIIRSTIKILVGNCCHALLLD